MHTQESPSPPAGADDALQKIPATLAWITSVGMALAAILAALFGAVVRAQAIGYALAIALGGGASAMEWYRRRRKAAEARIAPTVDSTAKDTLRFLQPFEEGDALPERSHDLQSVYTLVAALGFRFGVLWGESGCGKTSLLRAGLLPRLRVAGYLPVYMPNTGKDPLTDLATALARQTAGAPALASAAVTPGIAMGTHTLGATARDVDDLLRTLALPPCKGVIILWDQCEQFFLANRSPRARAPFLRWVGERVRDESLPVASLFALRADIYGRINDFADHGVPDPFHATYELHNFYPDQATAVLQGAVTQDQIRFESDLIDAIVRDLTIDDSVRPVELQVVGTLLKRNRITRVARYELAGRAEGLLSAYIKEEIDACGDATTAQTLLWLFCADSDDVRRPSGFSLDDILSALQGAGAAPGKERVEGMLRRFIGARIVVQADDGTYNLAHDYLVPYVRRATRAVEMSADRANRLLRYYLAAYNVDRTVRIPRRAQRTIKRYATPDPRQREAAYRLLSLSRRATYLQSLRWAALLLIVIGGVSGATTYFSGWRPDKSVNVPDVTALDAVAIDSHSRWVALVGTIGGVGKSRVQNWVWNVAAGRLTRLGDVAMPGASDASGGAAFDLPGSRLATVTSDDSMREWQWKGRAWRQSAVMWQQAAAGAGCGTSVETYSFAAGLAAIGDDCGGITLVGAPKTTARIPTLPSVSGYWVDAMGFNARGNLLIASYQRKNANGNTRPKVIMWRLSNRQGQEISTSYIDRGAAIAAVLFGSHDRPWLAAIAPTTPRVDLWDARTQRRIATVDMSSVSGVSGSTPTEPGWVAVSPDGKHLAVVDNALSVLTAYEEGTWIWGLRVPGL